MTLKEFIARVDQVANGIELWMALKEYAKDHGALRVAYQHYGRDKDWKDAIDGRVDAAW